MKLPPLAPLRAFEAAARHLSFTRAARELHVTQGAVSQQVKQLEAYLGFALFNRLPRQLSLTSEGRAFHEVVGHALREIADRAESLKATRGNEPVTISVVPSFAAKWLIPRLTEFRRAHPDIAVRVDADHRPVNLRAGEVDLAVRFTERPPTGMHTVEMFRDRVFPVCSPDLVRENRAPRSIEDLRNVVLLHDNAALWDQSASDWEYWLKAVGAKNVDARSGPGFSQGDMVLQAAILGDGVALTRSSLAELDLASGRLVKPLDVSVPCPWAHYLICLATALKRPAVAAVHQWLLAEGEKVAPVYERD
jgi:LysR family glycine cleavage system transcriptional activator